MYGMDPVHIAVMWDDEIDQDGDEPFHEGQLTRTYETFSVLAGERDAAVYIAHYSWYRDGMLEQAFRFDGETWHREEDVRVDVVFDKYKFTPDTVPLKQEIQSTVPVLNQYELEDVCKDKLRTYKTFPDIVPETAHATPERVQEWISEDGRVVIKPRFSFGGKGVEIIEDVDELEPGDDVLVQRFIDSTEGIPELDVNGVHDLRIVAVNGEPVLAYLRVPESGFISNVARGGSIRFVPLPDVPKPARTLFARVNDRFSQYHPSVYAVDMIFDGTGTPWVLELNSKPGMGFYDDDEIEQWKKPVMEQVVQTLVNMAD